MKLFGELIPTGSYVLRGWVDEEDGTPDSGRDIHVVGTLKYVSPGECDLVAVKGDLSDEMNIKIAIFAIEQGFKKMQFSRSKGGKASRWAKFLYTQGAFDYYEVDLIEQYKIYKEYV